MPTEPEATPAPTPRPPTPSPPTPSPTPGPTPGPTPVAGATVTGDPHVTTVDGRRFDLVRSGEHELVRLPRRDPAGATEPLLQALARVEPAAGRGCADPFVREVRLGGGWLERTGPLRFQASGGSPDDEDAVSLQVNGSAVGHAQLAELVARSEGFSAQVGEPARGRDAAAGSITRSTLLRVALRMRGATLTVTWVHRAVPGLRVNHLNFGMSGLGKLGMEVGGILGMDDHTAAAKPPAQCAASRSDLRRPSAPGEAWVPPQTLSATLGEDSGM